MKFNKDIGQVPHRNQDSPQEEFKHNLSRGHNRQIPPYQQNYNEQPSEYTDHSRIMNVTNVTQNNILATQDMVLPSFREHSQDLKLRSAAINDQDHQQPGQQPGSYFSQNMLELKHIVDNADLKQFYECVQKELFDSEEVLMYLYAAVTVFSTENIFDRLLSQSNYFQVNPDWHDLFVLPRLFDRLQSLTSTVERRKFDYLVLKIALEKDLYFMTELLLERSVLYKELLVLLLQDNQKKLLIQLLSKASRPQYIDVEQQNQQMNEFFRKEKEDIERDLRFLDIVNAALDSKENSRSIVELIKLMKNELQSQFFEDAKEQLNYRELYRLFIQRRKIKLIRYLFTLQNEFDFSNSLFIEALELEAYDMGALLYKEFSRRLRQTNKDNEYIITILISSLNKNNGQIEFKSYLLRQYIEQFILRHAKQFLDTLDSKIQQENKFHILVLNLNVVKTSCLLIELLEMIGSRFDQLQVRCKTIRQKITALTKQYMKLVEREQEMRYLLLEKDFENRDSLDLITTHEISEFLESQFADNVVKEIWRSPYATNNSIFSASTNHQLTLNYWHCVRDEEIDRRFYKDKDIKEIQAHPLQFTVWRFSGKSRVIVDFFSTLMFAILMHILFDKILGKADYVTKEMTEYVAIEDQLRALQNGTSDPQYAVLEQQLATFYEGIRPVLEEFYNRIMVVSYLSFLCLLFAFQHLADIIYASQNKRMINPYNFLNMIDLVIFALYLTNILVTYVRNLDGTWDEKPVFSYDTLALLYCRNYVRGILHEDAIWILCIVVLWVRVFYFLRYNEWMGKFLGVVERLIYDLFIFFCFYLLQLLFFACISELCFKNLYNYNTTARAFKTLFYASFGGFSFTEIADADHGEYFGYTFMIIFLVCNIGLIMSLFISIITVLYDAFSHNSNIYQMLHTLKVRAVTQADKDYSALVSLPTPLNALHFIFAPCLLTSKNPESFNKAILFIGYIPIILIATLVFIVYNIFLLPFTYTKMFFHKLVMIMVYSKAFRVSRADKFMNFCVFIFFGPFFLVMNMLYDIILFIRHLLIQDVFKTKHKTSDQQIGKENLQLMTNYFRDRSEKMIPYKQAAVDLREQLDVMNSIVQVLKPKGIMSFYFDKPAQKQEAAQAAQLLGEKQLVQMFGSVKEFATIKQVMERNSEIVRIREGMKVKTLDCKVLSIMMADILRHKTVMKVSDEDYIFLRRAINIKSMKQIQKKKNHRESMQSEGDPGAILGAQMDTEESKESFKRQRNIFKKLLFLNTKRMLEILKYKQTEGDKKRLVNSMKQSALMNAQFLNDSLDSQSMVQFQNKAFKVANKGKLVTQNLETFEDKIFEMGQSYPKINTALTQMKYELENLVQALSQGQQNKLVDYSDKISDLIGEIKKIKSEKEPIQEYKAQRQSQPIVDFPTQPTYHSNGSGSASIGAAVGAKSRNVGGPSPMKAKRQETESDIPDVDDD